MSESPSTPATPREPIQKLIRKWKRDDCRMGAGGASCHHENLRQAACNQAKQMVKELEAVLARPQEAQPPAVEQVSEGAMKMLRGMAVHGAPNAGGHAIEYARELLAALSQSKRPMTDAEEHLIEECLMRDREGNKGGCPIIATMAVAAERAASRTSEETNLNPTPKPHEQIQKESQPQSQATPETPAS